MGCKFQAEGESRELGTGNNRLKKWGTDEMARKREEHREATGGTATRRRVPLLAGPAAE